MTRRLALSLLGVALAALTALGVNLLAQRHLATARLDLTEQRLWTLSPGTRQVLAGLDEPVTLRLFYSRRLGAALPQYGAYADRVRAMLREYVAASRGGLRLEVFDPEPFSEVEDRALALGLQGVPLDGGGEQVFFGLAAVNMLDEERTIPFFQPDRERFLEADLTRIVFDLSGAPRPVVGLMTPLPLQGDPRAMMLRNPALARPQQVVTLLREAFTLRDVPTDAQLIADDITVLVVAHPQGLPDATQYALDQFVMRGGKLLLLLDPHSEFQSVREPRRGDTSSSLDRLLHAWGLEAPSDRVVLDLRGAARIRAPAGERVQAVDFVAWFTAQGDGISRDEVAVSQIEQVSFGTAGEVRRREGASVEFVPLVTSSAQSMTVAAERVRRQADAVRLLAEFRADGERRVLAARVRGALPSAFAGPPEPPEGVAREAGLPPHRARSEGAANLVVVNDTDLLEDRFWVRVQDFFGQQVATPFAGNGGFVVNIVETLAGSDAMISLRSRGESQRPFELIEDIRRRADAEYRATERQLTERLEQTERRLRELRQGPNMAQAGAAQAGGGEAGGGQVGAAAAAVITPEQRAEIDRAREEILAIRRQLRAVQFELRREIEGIEAALRLLNIAAVPALLTVAAVGIGVARARRRAAARRA